MGNGKRKALSGVAKSLRLGALAALGLGVVAFVFAFLAHGLDWRTGLDWARRLLFVVGSLCLVTGGCGLLVSGRDRPDGIMTPHEDDTFRSFWHEVGLPWGAAVSVAAVSFLAVGTVVEMLVFLAA